MSFIFSSKSIDKHICVIGDIMLDHYIFGACDRISPEAPVPVVDVKSEKYTLGGAGNVLENIKAFGCKGSLISVCGDDKISEKLNDDLTELNPAFYHIVKDSSRKTTIKTRVLASKHQLIRLDSESKHDITSAIENNIIDYLTTNIEQLNAVIISDYCKGVLTDKLIKKVINLCKLNKVITIVDSKKKDLSVFYGADLIKPNKKEASIAANINIVDDKSLIKACEKIAILTQCKYLVITLSEDGLAIYHKGVFTKMPTRSLDVFDVTGAGDTVVSALAFGLINDMSIEDSCDLANHAAAIVVGKVGSATATIQEINQKFLPKNNMTDQILKIFEDHIAVALTSSSQLIDQIAAAGEMVVDAVVNGNKILLCGNGGSAGDAQHIAAELVGRFVKQRRSLPAIALTTDTSALTAIGNDYGFDQIFERQVEGLAVKGDVLIGISTSGNSPNVLKALTLAKSMGCKTIGLLGNDGGKIKNDCDLSLVVPSAVTARIQEMHILIGHIICTVVDDAY